MTLSAASPEPAGVDRTAALLLDLEDAAQRLAISPRTLRLMVARKEVPVVRLGRRVTFSVVALAEWVASRTEWPA